MNRREFLALVSVIAVMLAVESAALPSGRTTPNVEGCAWASVPWASSPWAGCPAPLVFGDGFESGDTSAWVARTA